MMFCNFYVFYGGTHEIMGDTLNRSRKPGTIRGSNQASGVRKAPLSYDREHFSNTDCLKACADHALGALHAVLCKKSSIC